MTTETPRKVSGVWSEDRRTACSSNETSVLSSLLQGITINNAYADCDLQLHSKDLTLLPLDPTNSDKRVRIQCKENPFVSFIIPKIPCKTTIQVVPRQFQIRGLNGSHWFWESRSFAANMRPCRRRNKDVCMLPWLIVGGQGRTREVRLEVPAQQARDSKRFCWWAHGAI